jgi:alcohol dehydrogenase class IV
MNFEFATVSRIIFGPGRVGEVGALASALGSRALVVTGKDVARVEPAEKLLRDAGVAAELFAVAGEPTIDMVGQGVEAARNARADLVVGFGGGSAIDAAKAIAALTTNEGEPLDYLEVIGQGNPLTIPPLPMIAVPTTAGTGAEVTKNAVLASPEHEVKVSLRHPLMLPDVALVDPELTHPLPPDITAATGLDALTQLIEPYTSCRANPMTDGLCVEGIRRAARSLRLAFEYPSDAEAREGMALASLFGGLALANSGLGAVHGFAGPLGGMFSAPHGAICAALLPHVMRANVAALRDRGDEALVSEKYEEVARIVTGDPDATIEDGIEWVAYLCGVLQIPGLASFDIGPDDIPAIVENAGQASSMKANPVTLSEQELSGILEAAL